VSIVSVGGREGTREICVRIHPEGYFTLVDALSGEEIRCPYQITLVHSTETTPAYFDVRLWVFMAETLIEKEESHDDLP